MVDEPIRKSSSHHAAVYARMAEAAKLVARVPKRERRGPPAMWALTVAVIYFGTFLAIGMIAKWALDRAMDRTGANLPDVQAQAGANRKPRQVFLLGAWRDEN